MQKVHVPIAYTLCLHFIKFFLRLRNERVLSWKMEQNIARRSIMFERNLSTCKAVTSLFCRARNVRKTSG